MKAGSVNGRTNELRSALFYGISLLLSLIIVVVSVTVFIVVIFLEGSVSQGFFLLFLGIVASNILISGVSVWKLMKILPSFSRPGGDKSFYLLNEKTAKGSRYEADFVRENMETYFTPPEVEIINLLKENGNRMLQSSLVSSMGASKATISRAVTSLENKGAVIRVRKGVTNEIILSETYFS